MAEDRKGLKIKEDGLGEVQIAEEVITIIAGLAATEVEGVCSMGGNITKELVSRLGMKNLSKGVLVVLILSVLFIRKKRAEIKPINQKTESFL